MITPDPSYTPSALLTALQLADSFFPTGMFAHSHGLEGMYRRGRVRNSLDVEEFLRAQLTWSVLPADGVALLNAHQATISGDLDTIAAIDDLLLAIRLPEELRKASCQTGRRLLTETEDLSGGSVLSRYLDRVEGGVSPGNAAVAWAVTGTSLGVPAELTLLGFCHSYCVGVLGAAMRLLSMSHRDSQHILHRLHQVIAEHAREIQGRDWDQMRCFSPELDIASLGHRFDDLRMFAS